MLNGPLCVGVPERRPAVESVRPVGSALAVVKTTIGKVPCWLVVPARMPVDALTVKPVGSVALLDTLPIPTPPDCVNCSLNGEPVVPVLATGLVTVMV